MVKNAPRNYTIGGVGSGDLDSGKNSRQDSPREGVRVAKTEGGGESRESCLEKRKIEVDGGGQCDDKA